MARQPADEILQAFQSLNPWKVTMLPLAFKSYQSLSGPAREFAKKLSGVLATFPPGKTMFGLKHDLNAPVIVACAVSEPHLRLEMNAEYHLLRGECIVVHLAETAERKLRENHFKKRA